MTPIFVIGGTTASGKSELAVAWARAVGGVVLSCDSVQFYRGMDIGSAKLAVSERGGIPHYGLDLVPVGEAYDVGRFEAYAQEVVTGAAERRQPVVVCGGSGFYLAVFFRAVVDPVDVSAEILAEVARIEASAGLGGLVSALRKATGGRTEPVDLHNPRRVARALERVLATGKTPTELRAEFENCKIYFDTFERRAIWLDHGDATLQGRIAKRTRAMVEGGLIAEVESLLGQGLRANPSAANAVGYREVLDWMESGRGDRESLIHAINRNTWQLVRKQRTWFRNQFPKIPRWVADPLRWPEPMDAPIYRRGQAGTRSAEDR